nr:hypothetical protein [Tanacetum cinerariifolium]
SPCPPQPQDAEGSSHLFQQVLDTCSTFVLRVEGLENANAAQQLEIVNLKARVLSMQEDEEIIKSINETPAQKAAKRRKLSEKAQEADDLKKRLEIV